MLYMPLHSGKSLTHLLQLNPLCIYNTLSQNSHALFRNLKHALNSRQEFSVTNHQQLGCKNISFIHSACFTITARTAQIFVSTGLEK